jgi:hypothetical protein
MILRTYVRTLWQLNDMSKVFRAKMVWHLSLGHTILWIAKETRVPVVWHLSLGHTILWIAKETRVPLFPFEERNPKNTKITYDRRRAQNTDYIGHTPSHDELTFADEFCNVKRCHFHPKLSFPISPLLSMIFQKR